MKSISEIFSLALFFRWVFSSIYQGMLYSRGCNRFGERVQGLGDVAKIESYSAPWIWRHTVISGLTMSDLRTEGDLTGQMHWTADLSHRIQRCGRRCPVWWRGSSRSKQQVSTKPGTLLTTRNGVFFPELLQNWSQQNIETYIDRFNIMLIHRWSPLQD